MREEEGVGWGEGASRCKSTGTGTVMLVYCTVPRHEQPARRKATQGLTAISTLSEAAMLNGPEQ